MAELQAVRLCGCAAVLALLGPDPNLTHPIILIIILLQLLHSRSLDGDVTK